MPVYEFITPSDCITFRADDDRIACLCAFFIGNGRAFCKRRGDDGKDVDVPSFIFLDNNGVEKLESFLGKRIVEFFDENKPAISKSLSSFAYTDVGNRKEYDDACDAITDEKDLKEFRRKHEDENRSSESSFVASAWRYGDLIMGPR